MTEQYTTIISTFKNSLDTQYRDIITPKIKDIVTRSNSIVIATYQFIKLYCLYKYDQKQLLPDINKDFIDDCIRTITVKISKAGKLKFNSELTTFYKDHYSSLNYEPIESTHTTYLKNYIITNIITCIENNIKFHFYDRFKKFIYNIYLYKRDPVTNLLVSDFYNENIKEAKKGLSKSINKIFKNESLDENDYGFHFFENVGYNYLPNLETINVKKIEEANHYYFLKVDPQKYLPYMIKMNNLLESKGFKTFQCFSLRKSWIPKYVDIDTSALIDILGDSSFKKEMREENKVIKIQADLLLDEEITKLEAEINNLGIKIGELKKKRNVKAKDDLMKMVEKLISLNAELSDKKNPNKRKGKQMYDFQYKIWDKYFKTNSKLFKRKGYEFGHFIQTDGIGISIRFVKKMPKKDNKEAKKDVKVNITNDTDIKYIHCLDATELETLKNANKVYIDPGKNNLIYCVNDNGKTFRYTNRQRMFETKRLRYQYLFETYKKGSFVPKTNKNLLQIEEPLSKLNSATTSFNAFKTYINEKNKIGKLVKEFYEEEFLRKNTLRLKVNTIRSEDKLISNIKKQFNYSGKEAVLCYGDKNVGNQIKNHLSTPMSGLKKKLCKSFKIYHLDEFRTSLLDNKYTDLDNFYVTKEALLKNNRGEIKKCHGVLVSQIRIVKNSVTYEFNHFQNRDKNAVFNMRNLVKGIIEGNILKWFKRETELKILQESDPEVKKLE